MITYNEVYNMIRSALSLRPAGTKVQVEDHETATLMLLDYLEQLKSSSTGSNVREAHASSTANVNCNLIWNTAFPNTNYSYTVSGFDGRGNPVEIMLVSRSSSKLVVKTLINATLTAIAMPHNALPE